MRGLGAAVSLLTRLPVGSAGWDDEDMRRSVRWLPLVGALIGLVIALAYVGLLAILPRFAAAGLAVGIGVLVTGAFHEDGLADTVDGFGGGSDREDTLRIMKDPTHGTYGVVALVLSLLLRVGALATLGAASAVALLPVVHSMSRSGAIALMAVLPPATGEGLGAALVADDLRRQVAIGGTMSILIGLALLGLWVVPFLVVAAGVTGYVGRLARSNISGFTGDVLGATQQVGEVLLLTVGAALAYHGLVETVWWQ